MIKLLNIISRYLVALVFIFSGVVKLIDPYGTAYKISDYLETINLVIPLWLALSLSIIQSIVEFTLGMNALFKTNYIATSKWLVAVMSFFTLLTLYIAIANPVEDCGCFGDALILSNWQTFGKNIIIMIMTIIMVRNRKLDRSRIVKGRQNIVTLLFIAFALFFSISNINHRPLLDFRPYATGTEIASQMTVPEGMPEDVYQTTFTYTKDGVQEEFTEDNYPWQDSTWIYVDSKSTLISKGYTPPIHDFVINHEDYGDITDEVLYDDNYSFLLVAPQLSKTSLKHKEEIDAIIDFCESNNYRFLLLTATTDESLTEFRSEFSTPIQVANMDEITLKTIIRAYPGLVIIKDGVILGKYHHKDLPAFANNEKPISFILSQSEKQNNHIKVLLLTLLLCGVTLKLAQKKDFTK